MPAMRWPNGSATRPYLSSPYGPRSAPVPGASTFHRGADFSKFAQVHAVAEGVVIVVGTPSGWSAGGRQVWIQHDGFVSRSMHMGSYAVRVGQRVGLSTVLGSVDTTGTASGPHVHLEIVVNGSQVDPVPFIQARLISGSTAGSTGFPARDLYGDAHVKAVQGGLVELGYQLVIDGFDGPATQAAVRDFQGKNGLAVDGVGGPLTLAKIRERLAAGEVGHNAIPDKRSTADIQRLVGVNPDGVYGPDTTAAVKTWQAAHGLVPDGIWGPASDAVGFPVVTGPAPLVVDGDFGKLTIEALQRSLGVTADGIFGSATIKALQLAVGATADGVFGPETVKALQRSLGVVVDGAFGPETIKALQSLLNRGGKLAPVATDPGEGVAPPYPAVTPRVPEYPGAARAWNVPLALVLNAAKDAWVPDVRDGGKVTGLVVHHTTSLRSDEEYFKTANSRGSCPTGHILPDGTHIGLIPLTLKPSATGAVNEFTAALEVTNTSTDPEWRTSEEALEAVADYAAWLASKNGQRVVIDGVSVLVEFTLDRAHIFGDQEATAKTGIYVRPTACPGPFIMGRLDSVVARAAVLLASKYAGGAGPDPDPDPDPDPLPDVVSVPRSLLREWFEKLKVLLGGG